MSEDPFRLSDADYWHPQRDRQPAPLNGLLKRNFKGIAIGAPRVVPLDSRSTLPMLVGYVSTVGEMRARNFGTQGVITAVNRRSGELHVTRVAEPGEADLPGGIMPDPDEDPDAPPPPDTSNDRASHLELVELRRRLPIYWQPGSYLLTVIVMDVVSNRVPVRLTATAGDYYDEEVEKFLQREYARAKPYAIQPRPGNPVPRYRALKQSPAVPAQPGVAMTIERVAVIHGDDPRCHLYGSFRVPLLPRYIVRPDPDESRVDVLRPWLDATAVVDITLLITGSASPEPIVIPLHVPSYDTIDPDNPPAEVTGHFVLDLLNTDGMPRIPQTHFAYAFSGELLTGPVPFAFIPREIVPRRDRL